MIFVVFKNRIKSQIILNIFFSFVLLLFILLHWHVVTNVSAFRWHINNIDAAFQLDKKNKMEKKSFLLSNFVLIYIKFNYSQFKS